MIDSPRYLAAKKSVDDRSLNYFVWDQLKMESSKHQFDGPLQVLELGVELARWLNAYWSGNWQRKLSTWELILQSGKYSGCGKTDLGLGLQE